MDHHDGTVNLPSPSSSGEGASSAGLQAQAAPTVALSRQRTEAPLKPSPDEIDAAIRFLARKGVYGDDPDMARLQFARLRAPSDAAVTPAGQAKTYRNARDRAIRLGAAHQRRERGSGACEPEATTPPDDAHRFNREEFPGYVEEDGAILLMVHDEATRMQRYQRSGLCYMHASAVVQYYAVWHAARATDPSAVCEHGVLDLASEIVEHFDGDMLRDHVFKNEGGFSDVYLRSILEEKSELIAAAPHEYEEMLRRYGPALVSQFAVFADFTSRDVRKHHGEPDSSGESLGNHAMVMVGARRDASGKRYFLLQNWWISKQFVEVSEQYLFRCHAKVWFVKTPQRGVPSGRRVHSARARWCETEEMLDKAEAYCLEHKHS